MKVLFLDIDGVLNSRATRARNPSGFCGISSSLVKKLKEIIDATGAEIVLSSDWKVSWKNKRKDGIYLDEKLAEFDLKIIDCTEDIDWSRRGAEILSYVKKHNIKAFVILDDRKFDFRKCGLEDVFVQTNPTVGLVAKNVREAIEILLND